MVVCGSCLFHPNLKIDIIDTSKSPDEFCLYSGLAKDCPFAFHSFEIYAILPNGFIAIDLNVSKTYVLKEV